MSKSKKAQYIKFTLLITWAVFLVYTMLVTSIFTKGFVKKEMDVRDSEARLFANRIIYSSNGVAYTDIDLGKTYPGTVDIGRIDKSILDNAVKMQDHEIIAARVRLLNQAGIPAREAVYNELWYYRWEPLVGKTGSGGASEIVEKRYVMIYEDDLFKGTGTLEIRILMPNA